jgi:sugar phosphate isomerase/epimerase
MGFAMNRDLSRRHAIAALAGSGISIGAAPAAEPDKGLVICAFSKHFHWTDIRETAELCASLGFQGVDLTVRDGGHVLPERVEEDLPKAVELIRKAGLQAPMITTGIVHRGSPHFEAVLKTMAALKIPRYRWGGFLYKESPGLPEQLAEFKKNVRDLAAMNRKYGVCAMYHTHSGRNQVGASMWDLFMLLKDSDPDLVSANYDIGHATVEGGFGGWLHSTRLLLPFMRGVAVKDFRWKQNERGAWIPGWCPLGQGMVPFKEFFIRLREGGFSGPVQVHMEYPELGGADVGRKTFSIPKDKLLAIMKRDVETLKSLLRDSGWS